jgi:predicted amidohydrolase YtcJ
LFGAFPAGAVGARPAGFFRAHPGSLPEEEMKTHARVVVVGGGINGCSVLYHLAKRGWTDVVLIEKNELTSGSTWMAAGNVLQWAGNRANSRLHQYSIKLLKQAGGFLTGFGGDRLRIGPAKIIGDGSIQAYTAWLTRPYFLPFKGDANYCGYPVTPPEELNRIVMEAHCAGCQISAHGNGDAAIDAILEAFRRAQEACPRPDARHRIEHCQTVREDQLDLIARLGVSPSFFVSHTFYWGDRHKNIFLGPERASRINPLKSALKRGIKFSIHSDCPVTPVSPLFCVSAAVNRVTGSGNILGPEFRLTPEEALRAVTGFAAWQNFEEGSKGSIEPGKLADFAVLAENPLEGSPEKIKDIRVTEVIIGGKRVYPGCE